MPAEYVRSLAGAGANPVILPVQGEHDLALDSLVRRLDGLLFTGGPDIDPARYGAKRHPRSQQPRPARDERELALLRGGRARGPAGARHLPGHAGAQRRSEEARSSSTSPTSSATRITIRRRGPSPATGPRRRDKPAPRGRRLGRAATCPTHHHQGIDRLGAGLSAVAWTEDGTIEAVEDPARPFLCRRAVARRSRRRPGVVRGCSSSAAAGVATSRGEDGRLPGP